MCQFGGTKVGSSEPASEVPVKVRMAAIANEATTPLLTRLESRLIGFPLPSGVPRLRRCARTEAGSSVARPSKEFHSTFVEGERVAFAVSDVLAASLSLDLDYRYRVPSVGWQMVRDGLQGR
jgi:hypothetical protein